MRKGRKRRSEGKDIPIWIDTLQIGRGEGGRRRRRRESAVVLNLRVYQP